MSFSSPREAADHFRREAAAVVACVTRTHLVTAPNFLAFPGDRFVRLRGETPLLFSAEMKWAAVGTPDGWRVTVVAYAYNVRRARGDDGPPKTVIQFHHHPVPPPKGTAEGWVAYPHIHVETGLTPVTRKSHIPSGQVPLASAVRFLVTELGVAPLRADWDAILTESERVPSPS